jgi:TonB family protein
MASDDLYLRSPESDETRSGSLTPEPSPLDEVVWGSSEQNPSLLYDPLEEAPPAVPPQPRPDPADSSPLLFRLALSTAALLALLVLARGFWWPQPDPPEWAAIPRKPAAPAPVPAPVPRSVDAADEVAPPAEDRTLAEELASPAPEPEPAPAPKLRKPEPEPAPAPPPVIVEEVSPQPPSPKVERPKPTPPAPVKAAVPAAPVLAQRVPQPWEEGPQPPDLLKPGPGVEEPVPLDFPRYSYPAAARGTGLKADVRLAVLVDERGRVIEARVREGAPPDLGFAETAIAAAKRIPFQPASRYDVPGKMWTEVILEFVE